jgi:hypothetical protein
VFAQRVTEQGKLRTALAAVVLLAALLGAPACQMQSMQGDGGGSMPPPATATISLCDDGMPECPAASSFGVNAVRDLVINVAWQNVPPGHHVQTLTVLAPSGLPYQQTDLAFLISDSPGSFSAKRVIPVVGTSIPQRQLMGAWSVQASLDGQLVTSRDLEFTP